MITEILEERGKRYGPFIGHAAIAQELKRTVERYINARSCDLENDQKEAIDMICHKIARIINGDPDYSDNWIDIAGYAQLVADRLQGVER